MTIAHLVEELLKLPQDRQVQISSINNGVRNIYRNCSLFTDNKRVLITGVNGISEVWRDIQ